MCDDSDMEGSLEFIKFCVDRYLPITQKTFSFSSPHLGKDISVNLSLHDDDPGAYQSGMFLWPGARALAQFISDQWPSVCAPRVLELGSGTGLPAMACAVLSREYAAVGQDKTVRSVTCTDRDWNTLELIHSSAKANDVEGVVRASELDWGSEESASKLAKELASEAGQSSFDLILAADCAYNCFTCQLLFWTANRLLSEGGVFLCCSSLNRDEEWVAQEVKRLGWERETLWDTRRPERGGSGTILDRFTKRKQPQQQDSASDTAAPAS